MYTNSPVTQIDSSDGVHLLTKSGSLKHTWQYLHKRILTTTSSIRDHSPVRGQMLCTTPQSPIFERPIYADHGFDYWRQKPDGRIVLGGWRNLDPDSEVGYDETLHGDIQDSMTRFLRQFNGLASVQIETRWSGIMGFQRWSATGWCHTGMTIYWLVLDLQVMDLVLHGWQDKVCDHHHRHQTPLQRFAHRDDSSNTRWGSMQIFESLWQPCYTQSHHRSGNICKMAKNRYHWGCNGTRLSCILLPSSFIRTE